MTTHNINNFMRTLGILFVFLLSTFPLHAEVTLGYCDDQVGESGISNSSTTATISCAIGLTPAVQAPYDYCNVSYLRIGLTTPQNYTSFRVWLRNELTDETDLIGLEIDPSTLQVGWNDFELPATVALPVCSTLYCGYSYTQSAKTSIAAHGTKGTANGFFLGSNGKWKDNSSSYAPLCIRVGLKSQMNNAARLNQLGLSPRSFALASTDDTLTISGEVLNIGNEPLRSFQITCIDQATSPQSFEFSCAATEYGVIAPFELQLPICNHQVVTDAPIAIQISLPNGAENECLQQTSDTLYYEIADWSLMADGATLIEEFTSERNGYAPIGQYRLREAIKSNNHYILISHHEGYGPADSWRVSSNSDYSPTLFGSEQLTFVPAALFNREGLPVSTTLPTDSLEQIIASKTANHYFSPVIKNTEWELTTRTLKVDLEVNISVAAAIRNPHVVCCVKQDTLVSVAQNNYYPEAYSSQFQLDAIRCYLKDEGGNGALYNRADMEAIFSGQQRIGDQLSDDNNGIRTLSMQFSTSLPADIRSLNGLTVVCYIYDKDFSNQVVGTCEYRLKD